MLFRLHRSEKRCKAEKRPYRKITEHARELVDLLAARYPKRLFEVVCDAAYTNGSLIKGRPCNVQLIGRGRLDAALYAPAPAKRRGQMGRPRVRGKRVASPEARAKAKAAPWKKVVVSVYGRNVAVHVLLIDALWYVAAGSEIVRQVVVRGFPGHDQDDVFVSTDRNLCARTIIESFAKRWSLEVTFHETKGKLGFEDPQNRVEHAVERTAPLALVSYSLTVLWYVLHGQYSRAASLRAMPWYTHKAGTTFSDMLATLRRASWRERLLDPGASLGDLKKRLRTLVDYVARSKCGSLFSAGAGRRWAATRFDRCQGAQPEVPRRPRENFGQGITPDGNWIARGSAPMATYISRRTRGASGYRFGFNKKAWVPPRNVPAPTI